MDVEIEGVHTDVKAEWRDEIEAGVADLHPGHDITHVRVRLTKHDHRSPDDSHSVLIVLQIPGHTITAEKQQGTFEEAREDPGKAGIPRGRRERTAGAGHRDEGFPGGGLRIHRVGGWD
jgi:ribosome-associated translation inhibitor RaiA